MNVLFKLNYTIDKSYGEMEISYLKEEMDIEFVCDYFNDLIIVKSCYNLLKLYEFKNGSLQFYKDFPFPFISNELIKLKNDNFIMYKGETILVLKHI